MERKPDSLLSFVLLKEPEFPSGDAVLQRLQLRTGDRYQTSWTDGADGRDLPVLFFHLDGHRFEVALIPAPMPWEALEPACATNRFWPNALEVCQAHTAHLVVSMFNPDGVDCIQRHLMLTDLAAAVVEVADGIGVFWDGGQVIQSAEYFCHQALEANRDDLPLFLWVDFPMVLQGEVPFVSTQGLKAFGVMEIEGGSSKLQPIALLGKVYDIAHYICTKGQVVADGDTIGGSAQERIRVRYAPSVWERSGQVMRLEFDEAERPRGLLARLFGR